MDSTTDTDNLRGFLRSATADAHDALDSGMAVFELAETRGYCAFLTVQLHAREPIEAWCAAHAPAALRPPEQSSAIRRDLASLGMTPGDHATARAADFGEPLGVAWALGGSSLGNRAMLARLRKRAADDWPVEFLSDGRMHEFWQTLRPQIERPAAAATARRAAKAARAVFARFEAALAAHTDRRAA